MTYEFMNIIVCLTVVLVEAAAPVWRQAKTVQKEATTSTHSPVETVHTLAHQLPDY